MASVANHFAAIKNLNHAFSLLNAEKFLSHSQGVTGSVQPIFRRRNKFANLTSSQCFFEDSKSNGCSSTGTSSAFLNLTY